MTMTYSTDVHILIHTHSLIFWKPLAWYGLKDFLATNQAESFLGPVQHAQCQQ